MQTLTKEQAFDFLEYMRQTVTVTCQDGHGWAVEDILGNRTTAKTLLDAIANHREKLFGRYCRIIGAEDVAFQKYVPAGLIEQTCAEIWNHPNRYSPYAPGSEDAYYNFLKFLWVQYPDGSTKRLAQIATQQTAEESP